MPSVRVARRSPVDFKLGDLTVRPTVRSGDLRRTEIFPLLSIIYERTRLHVELTDFQRAVVDSILAGKVTTIETFLTEHCDLENVPNEGSGYATRGDGMINHGDVVFPPRDESATFARLTEFITLCKKLESMGLLFTVPTERRRLKPVFRRKVTADKMELDLRIWSMLEENREKGIAASPELATFVKHGYLTVDEENRKLEAQDRRIAQRDTRIIAYASIGVSVLISIATSVFSYLTYTKERSVMITNTNAFPDL
jgi:hypothetical protein